MPKRTQKKALPLGIERVEPSQFQKEKWIKEDMEIVNGDPEADTYLTALLKEITDFADRLRNSEKANWIDMTARIAPSFKAPTLVYGMVNSSGPKKDLYNLVFDLNERFKTYQGQDLRRFRRCEKCNNFFWADRLNKRFCTKRCQDAHNQAEHRKRTSAK